MRYMYIHRNRSKDRGDKEVIRSIDELNAKRAGISLTIFLFVCTLYFLFGVLFYFGYDEKNFLDSLYLTVVMVATVGYGDICPATEGSKLFTCFFVILGLMLTAYGLSLGAIFIVETTERMKRKHRNGVKRLLNRIKSLRSNIRIKSIKTPLSRVETFYNDHITWYLPFLPKSTPSSGDLPRETEIITEISEEVMTPLHGKLDNSSKSLEDNEIPLTDIEMANCHNGDDEYNYEMSPQDSPQKYPVDGTSKEISIYHTTTIELLKDQYVKSFEHELNKLHWRAARCFVLVIVLIFVGTITMAYEENWTTIDALYWSIITITTVGFGDFHPTSDSGKVFTIFFIMIGCLLMTYASGQLVKYPIVMKYKKNELESITQFEAELSKESIAKIGSREFFREIPLLKVTPEHQLSKLEFVFGTLHMMGKIEIQDVLLASKTFEELDAKGEGVLSFS